MGKSRYGKGAWRAGLLGEQERQQPLELAVARAIPCAAHQGDVLGTCSSIAYPGTDIFEMLEEKRDPLRARHEAILRLPLSDLATDLTLACLCETMLAQPRGRRKERGK